MHNDVRAISWENGELVLLDQTKIPHEEIYIHCQDYRMVADAICRMVVRGAPAIGVAAAFGVVLGAKEIVSKKQDLQTGLELVFKELAATRPTAFNLFWALENMKKVVNQDWSTPEEYINVLEKEAIRLYLDDIDTNLRIGENGAKLLEEEMTIMTICNAGSLATVAYGTALSVIRTAVRQGKKISVVACETRPLLQGARLTTWELMRDRIPVGLITDNMAGYLMQKGMIQAVITGADRVAANGDVVNKIGTYTLAVLAKEHGIPFYVAAPFSTVDLSLTKGEEIPIEERGAEEVRTIGGIELAPSGVKVFNPAFDLTPASLVSAIITEKGVIYKEEYENKLAYYNDLKIKG